MRDPLVERSIELCGAAYRVTDKLSVGEILRLKIRSASIDIIETLIYNEPLQQSYEWRGEIPAPESRNFKLEAFEKKIRLLCVYFNLAEKQGWVDARNFSILQEAYKELYLRWTEKKEDFSQEAESVESPGETQKEEARRPSKKKKRNNKILNKYLANRRIRILKIVDAEPDGATLDAISKSIGKSKRTTIRDLQYLMKRNVIVKAGVTRKSRFHRNRTQASAALF